MDSYLLKILRIMSGVFFYIIVSENILQSLSELTVLLTLLKNISSLMNKKKSISG
jgi:hypothetical protein